MTDLVIRKIRWEFDESVPFLWQPKNPNFSMFCNAFTFIAVPFEKYIIGALRKAQTRLDEDPRVAAEAEAFLRQEAQHASAHRKHMLALIAQYPGLEQCYDGAVKAFDELIAEHPVEFHAAYVANLEATFTPLFKLVLDNRDTLFGGGDSRVASLMAWHFVEEIEHRSSGLILCQTLNESPWYRVKMMRQTFRHTGKVMAAIAEGIDKAVPVEDRVVSATELLAGDGFSRAEVKKRLLPGRKREQGPVPGIFDEIPTKDLVKMTIRLALSQTPYHDPAKQPLPEWADTWMREYERGADMTTFFGTSASGSSR
jgi:predicted metal-dependent hydrolase